MLLATWRRAARHRERDEAGPATDGPGPDALVDLIRASVIGDDEAVAGPYGIRRVTYADYTASGRSLSFVEDYIRDAVLPLYANTHTESSGTGSRRRASARRPGASCSRAAAATPRGTR